MVSLLSEDVAICITKIVIGSFCAIYATILIVSPEGLIGKKENAADAKVWMRKRLSRIFGLYLMAIYILYIY